MTRFNVGDKVQLTSGSLEYYDNEYDGELSSRDDDFMGGILTIYNIFIYPHNNVVYATKETDLGFYEFELEVLT